MGLEEIRKLKEQAKLPKPPKIYLIPKVSPKKAAQQKREREERGDDGMDKFFQAMRKRMKGVCLFCGGKSEKDSDDMFHFSIAHLLPKRAVDKGGFPSVGTNEDNWIELCYHGNSCHDRFDRHMITWEFIKDSKEWDTIKEKLLNVLPLVAPEEKKHKLYSKLENLIYGQ